MRIDAAQEDYHQEVLTKPRHQEVPERCHRSCGEHAAQLGRLRLSRSEKYYLTLYLYCNSRPCLLWDSFSICLPLDHLHLLDHAPTLRLSVQLEISVELCIPISPVPTWAGVPISPYLAASGFQLRVLLENIPNA